MIAEDGAPYLVPLSYAAIPPSDGRPLRIVLHSAPEGRKIAALRRDPRVCFEVTVNEALVPAAKPCDFSVRFRSVVGSGIASFLSDPSERARALSVLASRYARAPSVVSEEEVGGLAVIEIRVEEITCKVSPAPARSPR